MKSQLAGKQRFRLRRKVVNNKKTREKNGKLFTSLRIKEHARVARSNSSTSTEEDEACRALRANEATEEDADDDVEADAEDASGKDDEGNPVLDEDGAVPEFFTFSISLRRSFSSRKASI